MNGLILRVDQLILLLCHNRIFIRYILQVIDKEEYKMNVN